MRPAPGEALTAPEQLRHFTPPQAITPASYCDPPGSSCSSHWQPSPDFEANIVVVLIVLLCALICIFALNAAIRCFLHTSPPDNQHISLSNNGTEAAEDPQKQTNTVLNLEPPIVYSASAGLKLAGGGEECAICLAEFMEGEGVRVLGSCRHGFHSQCIERWLLTQSSCPTCRQSCSLNAPSSSSSSAPELVGRSEECSQDGSRRTVLPEVSPESSSRRLE